MITEEQVKQLNKLNWDIQVQNSGYMQVKFLDSNNDQAPFIENEQCSLRSDFMVKYQGYMLHGDSNEHLVYICNRDEEPTVNNLIEFNHKTWSVWEIRCANTIAFNKEIANSTTSTEIFRNGELFCSIGAREMYYGIIEAQALIHKLDDPCRPWSYSTINFEREIVGLKCEWKGRPCTITRYIKGQNAVMLNITGEKGSYFEDEFIKDDLLSPSFNWWVDND